MSDSQKTAVIFGLANKRSIAWAIAQKLHQAGWRLGITYQNERLELEAKDLIAEMPGAAGFMSLTTTYSPMARARWIPGTASAPPLTIHNVGFTALGLSST